MSSTANPIPRSVASAAPAKEPLTVEELKQQLDLPTADTYHDELLTELVQFGRELVEHDTGHVGYQTTYVLKFDWWPAQWIELDRYPLISVTSITYLDAAGASQTLAADQYIVDTARAVPAIFPSYSATWPTLRSVENNITVTYLAGYATVAAIPSLFKQACKLAAAREFLDRQGQISRFDEAYEALVLRLRRATYP